VPVHEHAGHKFLKDHLNIAATWVSFARYYAHPPLGDLMRMDRLDAIVLDYLSERLFEPERLGELLKSFLDQAQNGKTKLKEKLRQTREARGDVDAKIARLLALVENGAMDATDPALKERLVALRLQKTELEQDIVRFQEAQQAGTATLSDEMLGTLSVAMRKRLVEGPQELRQAYMRLILENVVVGHHDVHLEGSPAVLERLARNGPSKSCAEVLSFAQGWRPLRIRTRVIAVKGDHTPPGASAGASRPANRPVVIPVPRAKQLREGEC
jgi:hypothetical protein